MTSDPFQSPNVSDYTEVRYDEMLGANRTGTLFQFGDETVVLSEPCWRFSFYDKLDKYKLTIFVRNFLVIKHNLPLYRKPRLRRASGAVKGSPSPENVTL